MVALLFGAVPLVASAAFWDQFASVKWYALEALALVFFLAELLGEGSRGWPAAVRRVGGLLALLFVLPLPRALSFGLAWAAPALVERLTLIGLGLSFFWYFRRNGGDLRAVVIGLEIGVAGTCLTGLAQVLGVQLFPSLTAGDQRSALFGNVNMAAGFLGFAVLALLATAPRPGRSALAREALVAYALVLLFALASRSSFLGVALGALLLWVGGRVSFGRLARLAAASATAAAVLLGVGSWVMGASGEAQHLLRAEVQQHKRDSSSLRFAAWDSTLSLVRDHPWGIGLGNFPDAFIPYQLESAPVPSEALYFRSPHDEGLRLAAEGGWAAVAVAFVLGVLLVRALLRHPRFARGRSEAGALLAAGGAFFLVEAVFQFPLDVAMGGLALSMLLGLAMATLEPEVGAAAPGTRRGFPAVARWAWPVAGVTVAACAAIAMGRIARSEWLYVAAPRDRAAQEDACRLNPRNLPACVTAAWLQGRAGSDPAAEATLRTVLRRSPYYFPAIKLRGEQALARADTETACRSLWIYDELFRRRSSVHRFLGRYCEPAQFERYRAAIPMPHYGAFPFDGPTGSSRSRPR